MSYCPHCGHEVSPLAGTCPSCGRSLTQVSEVSIDYGQPPLRLAGFGLRLGAFVVDAIIVAVLNAILAGILRLPGVLISDLPGGRLADVHIDGHALLVREVVALWVFLAYSGLLIAFRGGVTLGGTVAGVRVARPGGENVSPGQAFGRQAFSILARIPFYLGFFWMLWDPEKRTWHDAVAKTRVYTTR